MNIKTALLFLVIAPLIALVAVGLKVYHGIYIHRYTGEEKMFTISPGEGFARINGNLTREGIVTDPRLFHRFVQFKGLSMKFKVGQYTITPGLTLDSLAHLPHLRPLLHH